MKRSLIAVIGGALLALAPVTAYAQQTKAQLNAAIAAEITAMQNNTSGIITPATVGALLTSIVNSYYDLNGGTSLSCAAHQWVAALPTLSSITCDQPAFTDISGTAAITQGGTGATSQAAAAIAIFPSPTRAGDVPYWNGSAWVTLAGNNSGTNCYSENSSGTPSWTSCGGGSSTITAGTTATSGITSGDLIGSASNLVTDSGIPYANVVTLAGVQTLTNKSIAGSEINSGTVSGTYLAAINLAASGNGGVTGNLPVGNLNSGTSASSSTYWRGDGTWATPSGGSGCTVSGAAEGYVFNNGSSGCSTSSTLISTGASTDTYSGHLLLTGSNASISSGQASIGASSTNGGIFVGTGSVNDLLFSGAGGTICNAPTGVGTLVCGSFQANTSGTISWGTDTYISRSAAAQFLIGGAPVSGSNVSATGATIINNLSTGTATNPDMVFETGVKTTSGSTLATATKALTLKGETQQAIFTGAITDGVNGGTGGSITLNGSTSGSGVIQTAAAAGSGIVFQLPSSNGSSGQYLQTNGSGVTSWQTVSGSGTVTSITAGTGLSGGTITTSGTIAVNLSELTNSVSSDVNMTSAGTFYDGPTVAQGTSGTWWASGTVTVYDSVAGGPFYCKLWDGTTVISGSSTQPAAANQWQTVALSGYLASPAANIKISCSESTGTHGVISTLGSGSGNPKASTISVMQIN